MTTRRLLNFQRLLGMVVTMLCLLGIAAYSTMPRQEDPSFPLSCGLGVGGLSRRQRRGCRAPGDAAAD
ncbi:MAG: hypothetical protein MH213_03360 [Marinobacter sp.]|nr:hypothetical protein [Marinobacter sp.]